jgi:hypothetical protein
MSQDNQDTLRQAAERRLLDRYVITASDVDRSAFVGTSGRADWQSTAASKVLGLWPRIKSIPVLGPAVHRAFVWLRKPGG